MVSKKTPRTPKSSIPGSVAGSTTPEKKPRAARVDPKPAATPMSAAKAAVAATPAHVAKAAVPAPAAPKAAPKAAPRKRADAAPAAASVPVVAPRVEPVSPGRDAAHDRAVVPAPAPARVVTDEDIRVRAYFLSMEHRGQGSPEYFWMLAERELRARGDAE